MSGDFSKIGDLPVIWDGPIDSETLVILAHGAGAPMDTEFMEYFASHLSKNDIRVLRFEFPYMALRRDGHGKRPPNGQKILLSSWLSVIEECKKLHNGAIYIGGKSMGGRMATMVADEACVSGIICLGYPFYAPGKVDKPRIEHLETIKTPTLIIQGERDSMGSKENVNRYQLSDKIKVEWLPDGDHSLKPRKKSGVLLEENLSHAINRILFFTGYVKY